MAFAWHAPDPRIDQVTQRHPRRRLPGGATIAAVKSFQHALGTVALIAALLAGLISAYPGDAEAEDAPAEGRTAPGTYKSIHVVDFKGDIEALMLAYVKRRLAAAKDAGADCIVLRIESPGGTIHHGRKIQSAHYAFLALSVQPRSCLNQLCAQAGVEALPDCSAMDLARLVAMHAESMAEDEEDLRS